MAGTRASGRKTANDVYELVGAVEQRMATKLDEFANETRTLTGAHSVKLAVIEEKQTANVQRLGGLENDLREHGKILNGEPPETTGLIADVREVKSTVGWGVKALYALSMTIVVGALVFLWGVLTHQFFIVAASAAGVLPK